MQVLITGVAGFIGFHVCSELIKKKNFKIIGIDNLNNYYDHKLKNDRVKILKSKSLKNFIFKKIDIKNQNKIFELFKKNKITHVIHLAAQAGVRHSISNPHEYINTNIIGFHNVINSSCKFGVKHFIYASSSSVYGDSKKFPLSEEANTDKPLSLYAASKKSNEIIAYSYSNIFKLPTTGLRFFTVYGPFGRPDMALFKFVDSLMNNKKIDLYNYGDHLRDFTYIDDISRPVVQLLNKFSTKKIPSQIFNLANGNSVKLKEFLKFIEESTGKKANVNYKKMQKGDVKKTHADINKLMNAINTGKRINVKLGVKKFVEWYIGYFF